MSYQAGVELVTSEGRPYLNPGEMLPLQVRFPYSLHSDRQTLTSCIRRRSVEDDTTLLFNVDEGETVDLITKESTFKELRVRRR